MKELEHWEADEPPPGFADRVVRAAQRAETTADLARAQRAVADQAGSADVHQRRFARAFAGPASAPRRWLAVVAAVTAAAAAVPLVRNAAPRHGDAAARERTEVALADGSVIVLEAGTHVSWSGREVTQDAGDAFYRVAPGTAFRVRTPAGDVAVKGTCFRVKLSKVEDMNRRELVSGSIGAALGALAFVGVYEGRVALLRAGAAPLELRAGEAATLGPAGVARASDPSSADGALADARKADEPLLRANANLSDSVREYRVRLEGVEREREDLKQKLATAEQKLASPSDGGAGAGRHEFDVTPEEWSQLAKEGAIKYRLPCARKEPWAPSPETLQGLGLSSDDGAVLRDAYARSNARVWDQVKPLCAHAFGSPEAAEKLGQALCTRLILENGLGQKPEEAMRHVAEMRAGQRPLPRADDLARVPPPERLLLALTGEIKLFEDDLARTLGPEEAHRLAFSDDICAESGRFRSGPELPKVP